MNPLGKNALTKPNSQCSQYMETYEAHLWCFCPFSTSQQCNATSLGNLILFFLETTLVVPAIGAATTVIVCQTKPESMFLLETLCFWAYQNSMSLPPSKLQHAITTSGSWSQQSSFSFPTFGWFSSSCYQYWQSHGICEKWTLSRFPTQWSFPAAWSASCMPAWIPSKPPSWQQQIDCCYAMNLNCHCIRNICWLSGIVLSLCSNSFPVLWIQQRNYISHFLAWQKKLGLWSILIGTSLKWILGTIELIAFASDVASILAPYQYASTLLEGMQFLTMAIQNLMHDLLLSCAAFLWYCNMFNSVSWKSSQHELEQTIPLLLPSFDMQYQTANLC